MFNLEGAFHKNLCEADRVRLLEAYVYSVPDSMVLPGCRQQSLAANKTGIEVRAVLIFCYTVVLICFQYYFFKISWSFNNLKWVSFWCHCQHTLQGVGLWSFSYFDQASHRRHAKEVFEKYCFYQKIIICLMQFRNVVTYSIFLKCLGWTV